jgi:hypothetical protein
LNSTRRKLNSPRTENAWPCQGGVSGAGHHCREPVDAAARLKGRADPVYYCASGEDAKDLRSAPFTQNLGYSLRQSMPFNECKERNEKYRKQSLSSKTKALEVLRYRRYYFYISFYRIDPSFYILIIS